MLATRAAWLGKEEVVEVSFDPAVTSYQELLERAQCVEKPATIYAHNKSQLAAAKALVGAKARPRAEAPRQERAAKVSDRKYYLRQSPLWYLPLTPMQELRCNAALGRKEDPRRFLSPKQCALLVRVSAAVQRDAGKHWTKLKPARSPSGWAGYLKQLEGLLGRR